MEVKQILELACVFLGKEELLEDEYFLTEVPQDYVPDENRSKKIDFLLKCLNLVYEQVAKDYIPLICEEEIEFENQKFYYKDLSKRIYDVLSLKSKNGRDIRYKLFPTFIYADAKKAVITYSYAPEKLERNSQLDFFDVKVPARVFAYGVAMEFCFIESLSDEATIWEKRFKDAILIAMRKKSIIRMPSRRWI